MIARTPVVGVVVVGPLLVRSTNAPRAARAALETAAADYAPFRGRTATVSCG